MRLVIFLASCLISFNVFAGDEEKVKKGIIEKFTSGLSSSISNILDGEGDTKVQIDMGEDYHPEFSIVTVRPISKHHSNDATFIQLQLNEQKSFKLYQLLRRFTSLDKRSNPSFIFSSELKAIRSILNKFLVHNENSMNMMMRFG